MNEIKPGLVKFVFDYPFHLGLDSGFYYFVKLADVKDAIALIKVTDKEGIQTFDKGFVQRAEKELSDPVLQPVLGNARSSKINAVLNNGVVHVVASEVGKVIYPWFFTEIQVIFAVEDVYSTIANPTNSLEITRLVYKFFNHFLTAYRHVSSDIRNRLLLEEDDITLYKLLYVSEFTEEEKNKSALEILAKLPVKENMDRRKFLPYPINGPASKEDDIPLIVGRYVSPLKTDAKKPLMSPVQLQSFLEGAAGNYRVEAYRTMLLSGLERLVLDTDFRNAVISFDTGVDMTVHFFLSKVFKLEGKTDSEIEALIQQSPYLTTERRIKRLEENLNKIRSLKNLTPIDIKSSPEYEAWRLNTRIVRNRIVHEGIPPTEDATKKAFQAAQNFIKLLEKDGIESLA